MKTQRLFLLVLAAAGLLASGCTKKYYVTEEHHDTYVQGTEMTFVDFNVKANNWASREVENGNNDEGYFQVVLEIPEITAKVVEKGSVQVDRRYYDNNETIATPLPCIKVEKDAENHYYTTFVDYEWQQGYVYVFVTTSDLYIDTGSNLITPPAMDFRVIITQ